MQGEGFTRTLTHTVTPEARMESQLLLTPRPKSSSTIVALVPFIPLSAVLGVLPASESPKPGYVLCPTLTRANLAFETHRRPHVAPPPLLAISWHLP